MSTSLAEFGEWLKCNNARVNAAVVDGEWRVMLTRDKKLLGKPLVITRFSPDFCVAIELAQAAWSASMRL